MGKYEATLQLLYGNTLNNLTSELNLICALYARDSHLYFIKTEHTDRPKCPDDYFSLNFIRLNTDVSITSVAYIQGSNIRSEPHACYAVDLPFLHVFLTQTYGLYPEPKPRKVAILTDVVSHLNLSDHPCFQSNTENHIFTRSHDTDLSISSTIHADSECSITRVISYLKVTSSFRIHILLIRF